MCLHISATWVFLYLKFIFFSSVIKPWLVTASRLLKVYLNPQWIILSTFCIHQAMQYSPAPLKAPHPFCPPSRPPFHVTPVTCALWQHSERTPCAGCHGSDLGGPQSVRHTHTHTLTGLHTAARKAIDILLYGGECWRGRGRWELHCSELTAETRGKLERGWVCLSVSDRKCVRV